MLETLWKLQKQVTETKKSLKNLTPCIFFIKGRNIEERKAACQVGFDMDDGPFCLALDKVLATFKVFREAYYGGTFTGNHAHKCPQVCVSIYKYNQNLMSYIHV